MSVRGTPPSATGEQSLQEKVITIELRSMAKCALKSLRTGTKDYISNLSKKNP